MKNLISRILISLYVALLAVPAFSALATNSNLISNPSAETVSAINAALPADWSQGNWGANQATFSLVSAAQDGARAMRVDVTNYTSGDAKWYFTPVNVTAGAKYDFSDYYQSNVVTELVVQYQTATGSVSYAGIGTLAASSAWAPATATITVPANITKMTVFHLIAANGWLSIDNAVLSETVAATPTPTPVTTPTASPIVTPSPTPSPTPVPPVMTAGNLIPNPGVEQAGLVASTPNGWQTATWGSSAPVFTYASTGHAGSTHSVQIALTNYVSGDAKWMSATQTAQPNQLYNFSNWYKSSVATAVVAAVQLSNGTTVYLTVGSPLASTTWKQFKGQFTTPSNAVSMSVFQAIAANGTLTTDDYYLAADGLTISGGVPNSSLETVSYTSNQLPSGWRQGGWGVNTTTYSYPQTGHTGTRSVKVSTTAFTSGDAVWAYTPQPVTAGGRYRVTDWYKSNIVSEVELQLVMIDGSVQYLTIGHPGVATTWAEFSTIVNLPQGVAAVSVLHLIAGVGYLTLDDVSVVPVAVQPFNRPLVSVTFDDGWDTQYTNGLPLLNQYQIPATFYLISGSINAEEYITTAQALAMRSAGNELGAHSATHANLPTLGAAKLKQEVSGSQRALQQLLGGTITNFATPYGAYNQKVLAATAATFTSHRSTDAGYNTKDNFNTNNLLVQNVDINTTQAQVEGWLTEALNEGAWLILVYHEVSPVVDPINHLYNTTPTQLAAHLAAIQASGLTPVTIAQGLAEVTAQ